MEEKATRFGLFLLVLDEWTTVKFEHCYKLSQTYSKKMFIFHHSVSHPAP